MKTTYRILLGYLFILFSSGALAASVEPIRLYRLSCGNINFPDLSSFSDTGDYDGHSGEMVVPCYLIKHPKGWLMWDTGLPEALIGKSNINMLGAKETVSATIESQLKTIGVSLKDITFVSFSHMHGDHAGNANLFKDATWILQKKELSFALAAPPPPGIDPELFSALKTAKKIEVDGDYDIFGDGTVKVLIAPGHTPGHQVLNVTLRKNGTYILAGDLYHFDFSRKHHLVPIFNSSRAETLASIDRIEKLGKNKKAKVITQHEPKDAKLFPELPKYLE
jgi:N-acyl homoserine lactone hydrolase